MTTTRRGQLLGIGPFAELTGLSADALRHLWSHRDVLGTRARMAAKLVDQLDDFMRRDLMSVALNDDLRSELIDMFNEHQAFAVALFEQTRGLRPDRPGVATVGDDGEAAAWGIAQHADDDNELCHEWLPLLERAVLDGEAPALHLALLTDRILLRDRRPQRYGTILEPVGDTWRPREPVEDQMALDDRRRRIGLDAFDAWAATLMPPDAWYAENSG